ncbi:MAG: FtsX-like permease family protein [Planctomycetota bacterium]
MRFSSLISKNLMRRSFRSALTLVAFATAIASVVSLLGIAKGFTKSFAGVYETHSVDVVVSRQGTADRLSSSVNQAFAEQIVAIPGVARTAGVLLETLSLEEQEIYGVPTMGIVEDSWLLEDYDIESSPTLQLSSDDPHRLMLGSLLADRVGMDVGDTVMMFEEPYRVTGIFTSRSAWENGSIIMPLAALQALTDRMNQVTYINVVLDKPVDAATAAGAVTKIQQLDAKLLALTTDEFVETDTRMQLATAMAWMTSVIALVMGAIVTLNTMMTSVLERTQEIGVLRAIGWPRRRVVAMILMESCALAMVACVVGCVLAILLTWGLSQASAVQGILTPSIDIVIIAQVAVLSLGIGLLGATIPAWRAAQLLPTEAFRSTSGT